MSDSDFEHIPLTGEYLPVALYFEDSDMVEYVREDVPTVYRRIDGVLTLILDMRSRRPIGFAFKGFKNFYLTKLKEKCDVLEIPFVELTDVIERAVAEIGAEIFKEDESRKNAYQTAFQMAREDDVKLRQLPHAA